MNSQDRVSAFGFSGAPPFVFKGGFVRVFTPRRSGTVMPNGYTSPEESLCRLCP
jgi:hypothetical protein